MANLKIFTLIRIKTHELLKDSLDYLVDTFRQSRKIFTVSSPFGQILFVVQNLAQLIFYYIEDAITELNITQASRNTSVYGLAGLAGYEPSRSLAANGTIKLRTNPSNLEELPGNVVIIPNYLKVKCLNNQLEYTLMLPQDDLKINIASTLETANINIMQATIETQIFTGTGVAFQSIPLVFDKNFFVDNFFLNVYVNNVKWRKYDDLFSIPANEIGYQAKTGTNTGLDIYFGNGQFGQYPALGTEIRVEYAVTSGSTGNIATLNPDDVKFEFVDTAFNIMGGEVDLNEIFKISTIYAPDFGAEPEPIELTRMLMSKANKALIGLDAYELLMRRLQIFSIIRVGIDPVDERMITLFLIPKIADLLSDNENYFTIPESRFTMSVERQEHLLNYIEKCGTKLVGTDVKVLSPIISRYVLNINTIMFNNVDSEIVKSDIIKAISDYFLSINRKNRIPRSDLIRIIEGIDGVDSVNINIVSEKNEKSKALNPNAVTIGIDEFNDIIMNDNELPIIRGGWYDRYGNYYDTDISTDALGAVNIQIKDIVEKPKNV
jgi:hypothetical protein